MNKYLLKDPDVLYRLYKACDIDYYYSYNFLYNFNTIDYHIFYDILNSLNNKELLSLHNYFARFWVKTTNNIDDMNIYEDTVISFEKKMTKELFNNKLHLFIQDKPVLTLYVMNIMLRFLYPCRSSCNIGED